MIGRNSLVRARDGPVGLRIEQPETQDRDCCGDDGDGCDDPPVRSRSCGFSGERGGLIAEGLVAGGHVVPALGADEAGGVGHVVVALGACVEGLVGVSLAWSA